MTSCLSERQISFQGFALSEERGAGVRHQKAHLSIKITLASSITCFSHFPSHNERSEGSEGKCIGSRRKKIRIKIMGDQILPRPSWPVHLLLGPFPGSLPGCQEAIERSLVFRAHSINHKLECLPLEHLV